MSRIVEVKEATLNLGQLLDEMLVNEEEIIISRDGAPLARLSPMAPSVRREPGYDAGKFAVPAEFFQPLPEEILDSFSRCCMVE